MVTPTFAAAEDDAPLVECAAKIDVSTPAASSRDLSQRATGLEETALYGLMVDISSLDSIPRIGLVRSS